MAEETSAKQRSKHEVSDEGVTKPSSVKKRKLKHHGDAEVVQKPPPAQTVNIDVRERKTKGSKSKPEHVSDVSPTSEHIVEGGPSHVQDPRPKKKKKKVGINDFGLPEPNECTEGACLEEPVKKKRKKRQNTVFSDPSVDESLSAQARKALVYAYTQIQDPSSWKFNKASQNWLIRNVWSAESVPESYLPLAVRYLTNVRGGARETLIKACNSVVVPVQEQEASVESLKDGPSIDATKENAESSGFERGRARILLNALSSPVDSSLAKD